MKPYLGIAITSVAIIWSLVFLKYSYLGIIIGIAAIIWFFVFLNKKQDELEANFQKKYSGRNIRYLDKCAVFRAQESNGYSQAQGKGYLVLTDDELYFEMTLLNIILSIPVASIVKVEKANRLLGVNPGRPMLKVVFKDSTGKNDAIALNVKELAMWIKAITEAKSEQA